MYRIQIILCVKNISLTFECVPVLLVDCHVTARSLRLREGLYLFIFCLPSLTNRGNSNTTFSFNFFLC